MEKSSQIPRNSSTARLRIVRLIIFFLLASLLIQAATFAPGSSEPVSLTPPSEILLCQFGQWETEYWDDSGKLAFNYVGDPNPVPKQAEGFVLQADFSISKPTLLTAIVDVHFNPNINATHVEITSPGSLALVDDVGNYYGPFAAETTSAINNGQASATVLWVALVDNVELPPGHYLVIDSDTSSVLYNVQTQGVPATFIKGVDAEAYTRFMDGLVAANEPEPVGQPVTPATTDNSGGEPEKVTYSNPQVVVNNPPDTTPISYPTNNPALYCEFVTDKPVMVTKIMDYHINDGKGSRPGQIGLQEHGGTWYGSWTAYGQAYDGIPNAIWVVTPNFEIPAGSYKVMDNQFSTLSADEDDRAMCVVKLAPVVTSPFDNVTGRYSIGFSEDDGTAIGYTLVLAVIDHRNSLEIGTIVEGQPLKMNFTVIERANGVLKAEYRQGFSISDYDLRIAVLLTFTKRADKIVLTGRVMGEGASIKLAGARTSTDLPGFVPQPHAGIGKVGSIPGPGSEAQAVAGIAFPTLATLIAGAAASRGGRRHGSSAGSGLGTDGGEGGGGEAGEGGGGEAGEGGSSEAGEGSGGEAGEGSGGEAGDDAGGPDPGSPDTGSPDTGSPVQSQPAAVVPPPVTIAPPQNGPQDGQTMTVHDFSDGLDKTYEYHGDSGQWINPLTGGSYVAANYAASAQAHAETEAEINNRKKADANALADGPTKWVPGSGDSTIVSASTASAATVIPAAPGAASAGSTTTPAPTASGTTTVPAAPGAASAGSTIPPVPTAPGGRKAGSTPATQQGPGPMIRQGIINMKEDFEVINKRLADENIYVINKFQRTNMVLDGAAKAGNYIWDYTAGWVTGSTGLTCKGYYDKTNPAIAAAVLKQFPDAKVEQAIFQEKSSYDGKGVIDWLDDRIEDNHVFTKVTLPDGSEWAVDFHGHNASNLPTNPPIMRPYAEVRQEWKTHLGDEFHET